MQPPSIPSVRMSLITAPSTLLRLSLSHIDLPFAWRTPLPLPQREAKALEEAEKAEEARKKKEAADAALLEVANEKARCPPQPLLCFSPVAVPIPIPIPIPVPVPVPVPVPIPIPISILVPVPVPISIPILVPSPA